MKNEKADSNIKAILDNRYVLEKELGLGASSTVYRVKDLENNNKEYALKLFKKYKTEIQNEIEINKKISELKSPFFVKYITSSFGCLIKEKVFKPFIVFELASKGNLLKYIKCNEKGFDEKNCNLIFAKIILMVKSLHRLGIYHRDLKLNNIILDHNYQIKLCDFGFSTIIPKGKNGKSKNIKGQCGTLQYTAPEINRNIPYDGEKVDIFSLGVILFNLKTCQFGFKNTEGNKS